MKRTLHHVKEPQDGWFRVFFVRAPDHGVRDLKRLGFAVTQQYKGPSYVTYVEGLVILIQQQNWRAIHAPFSSPGAPAAS